MSSEPDPSEVLAGTFKALKSLVENSSCQRLENIANENLKLRSDNEELRITHIRSCRAVIEIEESLKAEQGKLAKKDAELKNVLKEKAQVVGTLEEIKSHLDDKQKALELALADVEAKNKKIADLDALAAPKAKPDPKIMCVLGCPHRVLLSADTPELAARHWVLFLLEPTT